MNDPSSVLPRLLAVRASGAFFKRGPGSMEVGYYCESLWRRAVLRTDFFSKGPGRWQVFVGQIAPKKPLAALPKPNPTSIWSPKAGAQSATGPRLSKPQGMQRRRESRRHRRRGSHEKQRPGCCAVASPHPSASEHPFVDLTIHQVSSLTIKRTSPGPESWIRKPRGAGEGIGYDGGRCRDAPVAKFPGGCG